MSIDAAAGGALIVKSIEAMRTLLDEMVSNNYHQSSERANLKRTGEVYGADVVDLLASKVDALVQRFDRLGTSSLGNPLRSFFGVVFEVGALCEIHGL